MTHHDETSSSSPSTGSKIKKLVGRLRSNSSKSKPSSPRHSADSATSGQPGTHSWTSHSPPSHSSSSSNKSRRNRSNNQARDATISLELWGAAYDALHDTPGSAGLVTVYEAIVSQELPDELKLGGGDSFRGRSAEERLHLLTEITAAGLHKRRGSRASPSQADDVAKKMLELSKDAIESVWPAYPSTAVAWAGICTLTPLLLDPILRQPEMRRGIVHVAGRIPWYMHLSQILLPATWENEQLFRTQQDTTRDALIMLYRKVLELQMNCVCATASVWNTAAKHVVAWNSLGKLVTAVEDADETVRRIVTENGKAEVRDGLLRFDKDMELPGGSEQGSQGERTPDGRTDAVDGTTGVVAAT